MVKGHTVIDSLSMTVDQEILEDIVTNLNDPIQVRLAYLLF